MVIEIIKVLLKVELVYGRQLKLDVREATAEAERQSLVSQKAARDIYVAFRQVNVQKYFARAQGVLDGTLDLPFIQRG